MTNYPTFVTRDITDSRVRIRVMPANAPRATDPWPEEREGYYQPPPVAYAPARGDSDSGSEGTLVRRAEQLGSLIAGVGIVWTAYALAHNTIEIARVVIYPPGPQEVLGVGVLMWLVAKWCRAVQPH